MAEEKYLRLNVAAQSAGVSEATLRNAIAKGRLKASTIPGKRRGHTYLITEDDLIAWVEDRDSVKVEAGEIMASLKLATVEQLATEIQRRIQDSYNEGVKAGAKQKAAELKLVLKQGGF